MSHLKGYPPLVEWRIKGGNLIFKISNLKFKTGVFGAEWA